MQACMCAHINVSLCLQIDILPGQLIQRPDGLLKTSKLLFKNR